METTFCKKNAAREIADRRARQESILKSIDDQMARQGIFIFCHLYLFLIPNAREAVVEMRNKEAAATTTLLNKGEQVCTKSHLSTMKKRF